MFDLSNEFQNFYDKEVRLSQTEISNLREKKKLNIDRLKEGLIEYNNENKTNYKIIQTLEQGSVAMSTIVKNRNIDYDIDVAIIFDKDNIENIGPNAIQNIIIDSLKRKCINMKKDPYSKTNCVRIENTDGYHIDLAIYRRFKNYNNEFIYEHAGNEWRERNPYAINNWFNDEISNLGNNLRKIVRLSKMFCNSRDSWNMPGGLLQTVLCDEMFSNKSRIDEIFYNTILSIKDRLKYNKDVLNPTSNNSLILTKEHENKIDNLYKRLDTYLEKLNILFDENCTYKNACDAWYNFFNNEFWNNLQENNSNNECEDNEVNIDNLFPIAIDYKSLKIDCRLTDSNKKMPDRILSKLLVKGEKIKIGYTLDFYIENTNVSRPYNVYWKIKNNGSEAIRLNDLRGEIIKSKDNSEHQHIEYSNFRGNHYVECYIVKDKICVASSRIDVPIE